MVIFPNNNYFHAALLIYLLVLLVFPQLDMETVCEYIQQELDSSSDPADQKLFIAEVALIDKQIMTMASGLISMNPPLGNLSQSGGMPIGEGLCTT